MTSNEKPVIVSQTFQVPKERLWAAITEQNQMIKWFFEQIEAFEPKVGFKTQFVIENEGRIFPHVWEVKEVIPYQRIRFNWQYKGYPGNSVVTFELMEETKGIKLELTHRFIESFPRNIPEFTRESCLGGWDYFINGQLKKYLDV